MSSKVFLAVASMVLGIFAPASQPASAQQRSYDIMVEEGGRPLQRTPKSVVPDNGEVKKQPKQPRQRTQPRGSGYVPPANLPKTEAIVTPQPPGVYKPPPIDSFSDRVTRCNHSFPLNAGIGNNPTDRSSYVRQCAN